MPIELTKTVQFAQTLSGGSDAKLYKNKRARSLRVYRELSTVLHKMQPAEISQIAVCRICYSGENSGPKNGEPLISPCNCKGTMGLYHQTCLKKWLILSNTWVCEICRFRYEIRKRCRSFLEYLRDKDAICEQKTLYTDILCFVVLTPLVFLSVIICISLAIEFEFNFERNGYTHPKTALAIGLVVLSFVLLLAYSSWLIVSFIFHQKSFFHWQRLNPDLGVIDQLSTEDSILINGTSMTTTPRRKFLFTRRNWDSGSRFQFLTDPA